MLSSLISQLNSVFVFSQFWINSYYQIWAAFCRQQEQWNNNLKYTRAMAHIFCTCWLYSITRHHQQFNLPWAASLFFYFSY